jgi:hypothetical protein
MNVVIPSNEYNPIHVYFTERRVNMHIANSIFNRIAYSTKDFNMNGAYIQFELFIKQNEQSFNSNIYNCHFDPQHEYNRAMLTIFQNIETSILDKWAQVRLPQTPMGAPNYDIIQQLRTGVISVWKHDMSTHDKPQFQQFIIKISGVWENDAGCGLTYKFI